MAKYRHYIFEDDERDDIQKLFLEAYGGYEHVKSYMHWAQGVTHIPGVIEEVYKLYGIDVKREVENNTDIELYIFMDLVPDNPNTSFIYNKIKRLKANGCNIIIFPIPCSEYYLIKMLCSAKIQLITSDIKILLDRDVYYKSQLYKIEHNSKYIKNFEKFCKLMVLTLSKKCLRKSNDEDIECHSLKGRFYRENCSACSKCSLEYSIQHKSEELLSAYPCFPAGANFLYFDVFSKSRSECIEIHRRLVDEYNEAVDRYKEYMIASGMQIAGIGRNFRKVKYFE